MANNFTPQELGVKRTTIRFRENLISPQPNYQKSIDKQGTLQKMTSLCFAARIKHGNTSSTNVTFPVPNKWSVQTRTKKTSQNNHRWLPLSNSGPYTHPISWTKAFLRLLASVKILQRVHSRPARSVCSFNGCTLSDRQRLPYDWATSILPKGKKTNKLK